MRPRLKGRDPRANKVEDFENASKKGQLIESNPGEMEGLGCKTQRLAFARRNYFSETRKIKNGKMQKYLWKLQGEVLFYLKAVLSQSY